jgi:hypothetical protein
VAKSKGAEMRDPPHQHILILSSREVILNPQSVERVESAILDTKKLQLGFELVDNLCNWRRQYFEKLEDEHLSLSDNQNGEMSKSDKKQPVSSKALMVT